MKTVDACGVSCPEPLLMLKNALNSEKDVMLIVDSKSALENCENYARKNGFSVKTTSHGDKYEIHVTMGT